jgi:hypothetical protein
MLAPGSGVRANLAFESLTLTPSDAVLVTATENALLQDGPAASELEGSPCRILTFDLATGQPAAEHVYWAAPVAKPADPPGGFATNGLVELLALGEERFLALERSFSVGTGNTIRLYDVATAGADDVAAIDALAGIADTVTPVAKTLLFDLDTLGIPLDNVEGMALEPQLADGRRTLVLVSDNNFSATQVTQILAFALDETVTP